MSKAQYRAEQRIKPMGLDGLAAVRKIVAERQAAKVNEVLVDAYSASIFIQVFDKICEAKPVLGARLLNLPVAGAIGACVRAAA